MTSETMNPPVSGKPSLRRRAGWWWLALTAGAIAVYAPLPYLGGSLVALAADDQGLAAHYAGRPGYVHAALYTHMGFAAVALLLSPLQFAARLRARAPRLHRVAGRITFAAILLGGLGGVALAPFSYAGAPGTAGFGLLGVLWIACAGAALRAIRRRDVAAHRRWAVRAFALTYAGVTLRLWVGVLIAAQAPTGIDPAEAFDRAYTLMPFLSWLPNLLLAELLLTRTPATPTRQPPDPAGFQGVPGSALFRRAR